MGQPDSPQIRCRIAPTPSGLLHIGNGVNFVLAWLLTRLYSGALRLRIDDADSDRTRPEFVEDIFRQLDWLQIDWDEGPSGPDDFGRHFSQLHRIDRYREALAELGRATHLFPCLCSRKEIQARSTDGLYPGTCRETAQPAEAPHAVRVQVPPGSIIQVEEYEIALCREMGDFVLWRRDDRPAYQLASLVDDIDDRISLIVRGEDLLTSTAAQLFLADKIEAGSFLAARFHHHPLIIGEEGKKLSKSHDSLSLAAMREAGAGPATVYRLAARQLGLPPEQINSLSDLLAAAGQQKTGAAP
ncbi:MAG: glutamate--tRNA ligase family protein [Thermodesulfobacteriota bacterium]